MAALQKELDDTKEKLNSRDELKEIVKKENEAIKLRHEYEKKMKQPKHIMSAVCEFRRYNLNHGIRSKRHRLF
jgi:hypothetical protein